MSDIVRIAMWSGPRNISTAMMRSFGARHDTHVVDEPFYAAYLSATGLEHPMREAVIASQSTDWQTVVQSLLNRPPNGKAVFYQKHMTHHMLPQIGLDWMAKCRNAFLIRDPAAVLASYAAKREGATLSDIGIVRQRELFEREADRLGSAPPVVDSADILAKPKKVLTNICNALNIDYTDAMLSWPAGRRDTDGVWAPAWYHAVEQSTGFTSPSSNKQVAMPDALRRIADDAQLHYVALQRHCLRD